jgi:hypothetical protein
MATVLTGNETLRFQQLATLYALKLECLGMNTPEVVYTLKLNETIA